MGVIMEAVMIKGCIFDLDGTLVDSLKDLAVSPVFRSYHYVF